MNLGQTSAAWEQVGLTWLKPSPQHQEVIENNFTPGLAAFCSSSTVKVATATEE